ncbi:MAG: restriction endonuclease subunit S [Roseburia sp.]|nr:restriction endonuclease subunit S [Roseburia sp.]
MEEIPFDIPENWAWVRLSNLVHNHGQKIPQKRFNYIDIGSINNISQELSPNENIIEPSKAPSRARKIVKLGDILYATVRPYLHNICIVDRAYSYEPIASTGFAVMCCEKAIENQYLFYYLLSPEFDKYANSSENAKGVAYPAINDEKLYKALVPLPPINEQRRIVAFISKVIATIKGEI